MEHTSPDVNQGYKTNAVEPDFRIRHPNFYPFVLFIGAVYSKVAPSVVLRLNSWGGAPGAPGDANPQPEWTEGLSQLLILEQPASTHQHPSLPKRGQSWGEGAKLGSETHISYQVASQSEHIPGDLILPSALVSVAKPTKLNCACVSSNSLQVQFCYPRVAFSLLVCYGAFIFRGCEVREINVWMYQEPDMLKTMESFEHSKEKCQFSVKV